MKTRMNLFQVPEFNNILDFLDKQSLGEFTHVNKATNELTNTYLYFQNTADTISLLTQRIASSGLCDTLDSQRELFDVVNNPNTNYKIKLLIQLYLLKITCYSSDINILTFEQQLHQLIVSASTEKLFLHALIVSLSIWLKDINIYGEQLAVLEKFIYSEEKVNFQFSISDSLQLLPTQIQSHIANRFFLSFQDFFNATTRWNIDNNIKSAAGALFPYWEKRQADQFVSSLKEYSNGSSSDNFFKTRNIFCEIAAYVNPDDIEYCMEAWFNFIGKSQISEIANLTSLLQSQHITNFLVFLVTYLTLLESWYGVGEQDGAFALISVLTKNPSFCQMHANLVIPLLQNILENQSINTSAVVRPIHSLAKYFTPLQAMACLPLLINLAKTDTVTNLKDLRIVWITRAVTELVIHVSPNVKDLYCSELFKTLQNKNISDRLECRYFRELFLQLGVELQRQLLSTWQGIVFDINKNIQERFQVIGKLMILANSLQDHEIINYIQVWPALLQSLQITKPNSTLSALWQLSSYLTFDFPQDRATKIIHYLLHELFNYREEYSQNITLQTLLNLSDQYSSAVAVDFFKLLPLSHEKNNMPPIVEKILLAAFPYLSIPLAQIYIHELTTCITIKEARSIEIQCIAPLAQYVFNEPLNQFFMEALSSIHNYIESNELNKAVEVSKTAIILANEFSATEAAYYITKIITDFSEGLNKDYNEKFLINILAALALRLTPDETISSLNQIFPIVLKNSNSSEMMNAAIVTLASFLPEAAAKKFSTKIQKQQLKSIPTEKIMTLYSARTSSNNVISGHKQKYPAFFSAQLVRMSEDEQINENTLMKTAR